VKKILVRFFAVIGAVVTFSFLIGSVSAWLLVSRKSPAAEAPANMVLELDLTLPVVEQPVRPLSLSVTSLLEEEESLALINIVRGLDRAKEDPRVKGIVARLGATQPSFVHAQEIRAALSRFREKDKFSYVFAPSYGGYGQGNRLFYLASAFENVWVQPAGTIGLTGLGIEAPFGKTALNKMGVSSDFLRRDEYKSVMENFTRDDFSAPVRANTESLLKNLEDQQVRGFSKSLRMEPRKIRDLMAKGPFTAPEAMNAGLITHIGYLDEMLDTVKLLATQYQPERRKRVPKPVRVSLNDYLSFEHNLPEPKATVAFINGSGLITDAPRGGPSRFAEDRIINTDDIVQAFADAAEDDEVKAILFRVDSPGGSPGASETIRHALVKARESKKPVFVSMGEVAASGGYWIAMNANHIIAEPGTITGSIGVVAGKFVFGGLWEKLGIKWDSMETSGNALMWSSRAPFSAQARERLNTLLDDTYKIFVANVAAARNIPMDKMPDIAKGRVWTGEQALKAGLVDELGGLSAAVMAIKKRLELEPTDTIALKTFPPPETPVSFALRLLRNFGIEGAMARGALGSWLKVKSAIGPVWDEIDQGSEAVSARVPAGILRAVR